MPKPKPKPLPAAPLPGDDVRNAGRRALIATAQLETAIQENNLAAGRAALEAGALPERATFRDRRGRDSSSALAMAMRHPGTEWTHLLLEYGAPLVVQQIGGAWRAALEYERTEVFPLLLPLGKPRAADWVAALRQHVETFQALDELCPMPRAKKLGAGSALAQPPLFYVRFAELAEYLVATGADVLQTPNTGVAKPSIKTGANTEVIEALIERMAGTDLLITLHRLGATVTRACFEHVCMIDRRDFAVYLFQHGFPIDFNEVADPGEETFAEQLAARNPVLFEQIRAHHHDRELEAAIGQGKESTGKRGRL